MKELTKKIIRYSITLLIVTAIASGGLAFTYEATKDEIARQKFLQRVKAVKQVVPEATKSRYVKEKEDLSEKARGKFEDAGNIFEVIVDGDIKGYAIEVDPRGYGGPMSVMVGIDTDGVITGVSVVEHKETPGLGSEVAGSKDFLSQYRGARIKDPVRIGEDIEAKSGATITSRGITEGVRKALEIYNEIIGGNK